MSVLSFPVMAPKRVEPPTTKEAIAALQELIDAAYGRALPTFNPQREHKARLDALSLIERYILTGGTL